MIFDDIVPELSAALPELRGTLAAGTLLRDLTWFRVGGPAQVLFRPADEADLAYFLKNIDPDLPIQVIGLGSNTLVRDGGVEGVVIRLARGFSDVTPEPGHRLRVGVAVPDVKVARAAAEAGIAGLAFYRGIPGCIGGALRMNAGAHGSETKDVLVEARAVDRQGNVHVVPLAEMGLTYRHAGVPDDWIFTEALFHGRRGDPAEIQQQMSEVAEYREAHQPTRERTGGSTFKNPPGESAWRLVDQAGMRGYRVGGACVSEKHCNFLINDCDATAEDIETLGETVRARVQANSGITLQWEIKRIGVSLGGRPIGEALAQPVP
ncbi:MAG: UDP-N-acetylmuramate dehydrogenase [Alphaproteobacteria bacterium]|nr:UDP-N-acetylmuramate dehydrogenase [Alphaproteobacteria bacterium]